MDETNGYAGSDTDLQHIRFKRRFLDDLKEKQGTEVDSDVVDPISLLNAIIQTQEQEDWFYSSDDDDDEVEGQSGSYQEDEEEYPSSTDTFSGGDPPQPKSQPRLLPLPLPIPRPPRVIKQQALPPPLRSIKGQSQGHHPVTDFVSTEPKQPIRLFKCGKCVSVFSSQKSLTIHKLQRHMNGSSGGGGGVRVRNGGGRATVTPKSNGVAMDTNGSTSSLEDYMYQQQQIPDYYDSDELLLAGMDPKDILKCTYCPRQFPNPSTLKVHMNTHTRERPYECSYCQKRFFQSSHLTVHIRTHTGEKPYQCQFCQNAFNSPSNCRVHERTHMKGNEIYQCEECNIGFLHKSRLERHLRSRKHVHPGGIVPRLPS